LLGGSETVAHLELAEGLLQGWIYDVAGDEEEISVERFPASLSFRIECRRSGRRVP
jgi:hypothetical protein